MQRLERQIRINTSINSDRTKADAKMIIPGSEMTGGSKTGRLEGL